MGTLQMVEAVSITKWEAPNITTINVAPRWPLPSRVPKHLKSNKLMKMKEPRNTNCFGRNVDWVNLLLSPKYERA